MQPGQVGIVAWTEPADTERGQWYFQRYAAAMPAAGEIVFFDRSWYNRPGVERVMGLCTPYQTETVLREAPVFDGMLERYGTRVLNLFPTYSLDIQNARVPVR